MTLQLLTPSRAEAELLPEVAALLSTVFRRKRPWLAELRWLYLENPLGRALWVNARDDQGRLVAHYALLPWSAFDDARFGGLKTYLSLNVAVDPDSKQPGLMIATTRALLQHVSSLDPAVVLGVANANAVGGFTKLLKFEFLGRLSLQFFPPWRIPAAHAPRALRLEQEFLKWRAARPEADHYARPERGALMRRTSHQGLPLDAMLAVGLPEDAVAGLSLPRAPRSSWPFVPRLYATFGAGAERGIPIPERFRPSPLNYIYRVFAPGIDVSGLSEFLESRRFEFLDFDVV